MAETDRDLSPKQAEAIKNLLITPSLVDAAQKSGTSERTLRRWMGEGQFRTAYEAARNRLLEGTLTALQSACVAAVATLREVMADTAAQPSARVSAAKTVCLIPH